MINACELSKYVILKAAISGKSITHLKLQKILYYLQGEHFKAFGRPLFPERIEAWQYGPVVPNVYYQYVPYGALNLSCLFSPTDKVNLQEVLSPEEIQCIDRVIDSKLNCTASSLVSATHKEAPWLEQADLVKEGKRPVISNDSIYKFFVR